MKTRQITGGGLMAAAVVAVLWLSTALPSLSLSCAASAGFLVMFVYLRWGVRAMLLCYTAASLLSLLVLPSKEAAAEFVFFFGLYPLVKTMVEKIPHTLAGWGLKMVYCNVVALVFYQSMALFFTVPDDLAAGPLLTLMLFNAAFVLYDIAFTRVMRFVLLRYGKMIS